MATKRPIAEAGKTMEARETVSRSKGPWVLAILEEIVGEATFLRIIREFMAVHRGGEYERILLQLPNRLLVRISNLFL